VESISRLDIGVCIFLNLFYNLIGVILSMVSDISLDSEALKVTSLILKVYQLSLLKMLVEIKLRACFHKIESMCVFVSVASRRVGSIFQICSYQYGGVRVFIRLN